MHDAEMPWPQHNQDDSGLPFDALAAVAELPQNLRPLKQPSIPSRPSSTVDRRSASPLVLTPGAVPAPDLLHRDFTATRPDAT